MLAGMPIAYVQAMMHKSPADRAKIAFIKSRIKQRTAQPIEIGNTSHLISDKDFDFSEKPKQSNAVPHRGSVIGVAFSPSANQVVSGSVDEGPIIWDVKTGKKIESLKIIPSTCTITTLGGEPLLKLDVDINPWLVAKELAVVGLGAMGVRYCIDPDMSLAALTKFTAMVMGCYGREIALGYMGAFMHEHGHGLASGESYNIRLEYFGTLDWGGLCRHFPSCRKTKFQDIKRHMCGPLAGMFAVLLQNIGVKFVDGYVEGGDWKESLVKGLSSPFPWLSDLKCLGENVARKMFLVVLKIIRYRAFYVHCASFMPTGHSDGMQILAVLGCNFSIDNGWYELMDVVARVVVPALYFCKEMIKK